MQPQQIQVTPEQLQMLMKQQQYQQGHPPQMAALPKSQTTGINMKGPDGKDIPFLVQAKDCVSDSILDNNMAENFVLIDDWVQVCKPNKGRVFIASAGPSTEKYIDLVKQEKAKGSLIVCIKHSLPILLKHGITPDACVILDPRPLDGVSTHNIVRKDLFKIIPKETTFFIAAMTNPEVTKYLKSRGAKIKGWVAEVNQVKEKFKVNARWSVVGGSCSAIRAVTLFKALGFSDFGLLGFDCSFNKPPEDVGAKLADGRPKYLSVNVNGKNFISTGELIALSQDIERLMNFPMLDFNMEFYGEGIPVELLKNHKQRLDYYGMLKTKRQSWEV